MEASCWYDRFGDGTMIGSQVALPCSSEELEALIRQVVREEFASLMSTALIPVREDGPGVSVKREDAALLQDGLAILRADGERPEAWMSARRNPSLTGQRRLVNYLTKQMKYMGGPTDASTFARMVGSRPRRT